MLHPVHHFAVEHFRDGNVRHRRCRRRTVPVLVVRRTPDDIAGADFLDRPAFALRPADARRDDQRLSERMRVPCGARAGLERDNRPADAGGVGALKGRVYPDIAGELFRRSLDGRLRTASHDFHSILLRRWRFFRPDQPRTRGRNS
jgi:hypothetical protein